MNSEIDNTEKICCDVCDNYAIDIYYQKHSKSKTHSNKFHGKQRANVSLSLSLIHQTYTNKMKITNITDEYISENKNTQFIHVGTVDIKIIIKLLLLTISGSI